MAFRIVADRSEVAAFVTDVRAAADSDREALGFLPAPAYDTAVRKGEITLVLRDDLGGARYAGHVWVSGTYPHARIVQLFVALEFRGQSLSTRLLRAAIQAAEAHGYMSIRANVASDLPANRVYEHHGFSLARKRPGGRSRKREINVRVRELETPTLFTHRRASVVAVHDPEGAPETQPLYLLDLNVFFDATRKRRTTPAAEKIIAAAFGNGVRLAVTSEFVRELQGTSSRRDDPVLSFAKQLPSVSGPSKEEVQSLAGSLAAAVFPERTRDGILSANDQADLRHLAEAILVGAAGFVTGERAIIRAHEFLVHHYGLSIWSPEEFADIVAPDFEKLPALIETEHDLSFREESLTDEARDFLSASGVTPQTISKFSRRDAADKRFRYLTAREATTLVAFSAFRASTGPKDEAELLLSANQGHPATPTAADFLLESAVRTSALVRPSRIALTQVPGQSAARRIAIANGFLGSSSAVEDQPSLRKITLGRVVVPGSWSTARGQLEAGTGLTLPLECPIFQNSEQEMEIALDGKVAVVSLADLESMLAPGLFLLPGRPVAVVPIRRVWAQDLIGSAQLTFLAKPEAAFRSRRVYFASVANRANLVRGRLVVLYESAKGGGRGAAIAVARVSKAEVVPKAHAPDSLLRAAVVRGSQLDNLVRGASILVAWFDNIMRFEKPVPFQRLEALGVDDKTRLIRSYMVNFETAVQIIDAGQPNAR